MTALVVVVSSQLFCSVASGFSVDPALKETLRGLKAVIVIVNELTPEAERDGLSRQQAQIDVELRLRQAGIRLLTLQAGVGLSDPAVGLLSIAVHALKSSAIPVYAVNMHAQLLQRVSLNRTPQVPVWTTTWFTSRLTITGTAKLKEVRPMIVDLVDQFINDYLAVNPK